MPNLFEKAQTLFGLQIIMKAHPTYLRGHPFSHLSNFKNINIFSGCTLFTQDIITSLKQISDSIIYSQSFFILHCRPQLSLSQPIFFLLLLLLSLNKPAHSLRLSYPSSSSAPPFSPLLLLLPFVRINHLPPLSLSMNLLSFFFVPSPFPFYELPPLLLLFILLRSQRTHYLLSPLSTPTPSKPTTHPPSLQTYHPSSFSSSSFSLPPPIPYSLSLTLHLTLLELLIFIFLLLPFSPLPLLSSKPLSLPFVHCHYRHHSYVVSY